MATGSCAICGTTLVAFTDLPDSVRADLEADPERQGQPVPHRRENHTACPNCGFEIHGCGQPYAFPEEIPKPDGAGIDS